MTAALRFVEIHLSKYQGTDALISLLPVLAAELPSGIRFEDDEWEAKQWQRRWLGKSRMTLIFSKIAHPECKILAKVFILLCRKQKKIQFGQAYRIINVMHWISEILGERPYKTLSQGDLTKVTERFIAGISTEGNRSRSAEDIKHIATLSRRHLNLPLHYENRFYKKYLTAHGRFGDPAVSKNKLLSDGIIAGVVSRATQDRNAVED